MVDVLGLPDEVRAQLAPLVAAYIAALEATIAQLQVENTGLRTRVEALEARLHQDSTNSSRPPSSDPPRRPPSPPARRGSRRPGGQPGHRGTFRALLPAHRVDQVQHVAPPVCERCGDALPSVAAADDPPDVRHQVTELPRVPAVVTEYQLAARRCGRCGHLTRAAVPAAVPRGAFGPVLQAALTLLTGRYRLSKREAADCMETLFGVPVAVGSVSGSEQAMSTALGPIVATAAAAAQQVAVANLDETGWRQGRRRVWLWTMVTATVTVFRIDRHRSGAVVQDLLGPAWAGIVGSDRYPAYKCLPLPQRQVCWAHARRDFQRLVDYGPGTRPVGARLLAITAQVFELWHRFKAGEVARTDLRVLVGRVAAEMAAVLATGAERGHPLAQTLCREYQAVWPALWTFIVVDGVEPTNNAAEQALRPAVLWRKGSFGTHSAAGSRFVERMLTVSATCRQHGWDLLAFLVAALTAAQCGTAPPSLLPALST
jgi:transposase